MQKSDLHVAWFHFCEGAGHFLEDCLSLGVLYEHVVQVNDDLLGLRDVLLLHLR